MNKIEGTSRVFSLDGQKPIPFVLGIWERKCVYHVMICCPILQHGESSHVVNHEDLEMSRFLFVWNRWKVQYLANVFTHPSKQNNTEDLWHRRPVTQKTCDTNNTQVHCNNPTASNLHEVQSIPTDPRFYRGFSSFLSLLLGSLD